jgi:hypothetical protein
MCRRRPQNKTAFQEALEQTKQKNFPPIFKIFEPGEKPDLPDKPRLCRVGPAHGSRPAPAAWGRFD